MEGAKSRAELLLCEAVVSRVRCLKVPPPSPRGVMKLMSSKKNLLMWLTLNKTKLLFNDIEPEICIKRILGATKDGRVGAEEIPEPVHLRLGPWTMIAGIVHLIDYVRHKFSLSSQNVHEGWVNRRIRKGASLLLLLPPDPLAPSISVPERNTTLLLNKIG